MRPAAPTSPRRYGRPAAIVLVLGALALFGCRSNPLRPEPNLSLAESGEELAILDDFFANLDLNDAVTQVAVQRPSPKELVDAQIAAMIEYVRARTGRAASSLGVQAPTTLAGENQRKRLGFAALALLPYLDIETGEAELGIAAESALAKALGADAEGSGRPPSPPADDELGIDFRDGVGVLRVRRLSDGQSDRVLAVLSQWAAASPPPRAILLDVSECQLADPADATAVVNAFAPGVTAFEFEYRNAKSLRVARSTWRGAAERGIAELAKTPLFLWVSSRSSEIVEATALTLRDQRHATLLGERTSGKGKVTHWQRMPNDRWFGFSLAYVFDGQGLSLRERPLYPDACPVGGELVPVRERAAAAYDEQCKDPGTTASLESVLRYVARALPTTAR